MYFELPGKTFVAYNIEFQLSFPDLWWQGEAANQQ